MKNKIFILIAGVFFVGMPFVNASVVIEAIENESARDAILADENVSTTATAVVRAGGSVTYELGIGNFETLTDFNSQNLVWNINGDNSFQITYDGGVGGTGTLLMSVTPDGGSTHTVITEPIDWFNQMLFSFEAGPGEINFTGTVNDEPINLTAELSPTGSWSGINIAFHDNNEDNVESFTIVGNMAISTPFPDLGGDQFRGEFHLTKNSSIVPEPSDYAVSVASLALLYVAVWRRRK